MSVLNKIPKFTMLGLFKEWLSFKEMGTFDMGLCNCEGRTTFLKMFEQNTFTLNGDITDIVKPISIEMLEWLHRRNFHVRCLRLQVCPENESRIRNILICDSQLFSEVKVLQLYDCDVGCDEGGLLSHIVEKCIALKQLFLMKNKGIILELIAVSLPTCLEKIDINWCEVYLNAGAMAYIGQRCCHLKEFSIKSCRSINGLPQCDVEALNYLSEGCPELSVLTMQNFFPFKCESLSKKIPFPSLTHLDLGANTSHHYQAVASGETLCHVVSMCPRLQVLDISSCSVLKNSDVMVIAQTCSDLRNIDLSGCIRLTDEALVYLAHYCEHLQSVSISGTQSNENKPLHSKTVTIDGSEYTVAHMLSDKGVEVLAQKCSKLHALTITNCVQVTNTSILRILNACLELQELSICGCKVDDVLVNAIRTSRSDKLKRFQYSIGAPSAITKDAIKILKTVRPTLKYC